MATMMKLADRKAMEADDAASLRSVVLELAGDDPVARDKLLLKLYECFLRGMAGGGYAYQHRSQDAARAILGLPAPDED